MRVFMNRNRSRDMVGFWPVDFGPETNSHEWPIVVPLDMAGRIASMDYDLARAFVKVVYGHELQPLIGIFNTNSISRRMERIAEVKGNQGGKG